MGLILPTLCSTLHGSHHVLGPSLCPVPLLCPRYVPLQPQLLCYVLCALNRTPVLSLQPREVPWHWQLFAACYAHHASPPSPACTPDSCHHTSVPTLCLRWVLPHSHFQTGPTASTSPHCAPERSLPPVIPQTGPAPCLASRCALRRLLPPPRALRGSLAGTFLSTFPPHLHGCSALFPRGVPSQSPIPSPPAPPPHAPRPLALMKCTAVSGPPSSAE